MNVCRPWRTFAWFAAAVLAPAAAAGQAALARPAGSPSLASAPAAQAAERVLEESGVRDGLAVLIGADQTELAVALAKTHGMLVHVLVRDAPALQQVRRRLQLAGVSGRASAARCDGPALPYADDLVNLLLAGEAEAGRLAPGELDRVTAPYGAVGVRTASGWSWRRPAAPGDVDQWTHARYDATGNAVSKDQRVGPPRYLQWEAGPRWNRGVKTSGLVADRGRLFYILDDAPFGVSRRSWSLIARNAYNGLLLWRRELSHWPGAGWGKKVGPAQVNRRLIAAGGRVYAALSDGAPVSVLDAASGDVLAELEGTEGAVELILSGGALVVLLDPGGAAAARRGRKRPVELAAFDSESHKPLWRRREPLILPLTLAADGRQVVYHDGRAIRSLDLRTGDERWTSAPTGQQVVYRDQANPDQPGAEKGTIVLAPQFAPTLIIYQGVVAFAGGRQLNVVSAADGRELWRAAYAPSNYSVPVDLFGFGGRLWGPDPTMNFWRPLSDELTFLAFDPLTGEVTDRVSGSYRYRFQHHRCHQMKVAGRSILAGRAGVEFVDTRRREVTTHHWLRGSCYYGVLPANGRLYAPPHNCACYVRAKLTGLLALNSRPPGRSAPIPPDQRLEPGPAYEATRRPVRSADPEDWPTHRADARRSGRSATTVAPALQIRWARRVGGALTSPVVAGGRVYVADREGHTVYAIDATTGAPQWRFTADARVDSPPTIYQGLAIFGVRDGSVVALRAEDGALAWRFQACPEQRWIVSHGQLESAWPVPGAVLAEGGLVYFAAGRSSYLDGGLRLYGLEPHTGRVVVERVLSSRQPDGSETLDAEGVDGWLNDVLSSDGRRLFLRHHVFNLQGEPQSERALHLHSPDGYLHADTTDRLLWTYAPMYTSPHQGAFYDVRISRLLFPSGRLLVEGREAIYGFGRNHYERPVAEPGGRWALFAADKNVAVPLNASARQYRQLALSGKRFVRYRWWRPIPVQVWAMVKTPEALFVAGPPGADAISPAAWEGKTEARLLAVSPADGRVLHEMTLPSRPVWDGMAAARSALYAALADGRLVRLDAEQRNRSRPGAVVGEN